MLTPLRWNVPRELSPEEARVAAKLHRSGKSVAFARAIRTELFDEAFQAELAAAYRPRGVTPRPPALLAMVTLLQAYDQVGDAEAVVAAAVDQRWQLVLGCLGATDAPFSQGALVKLRERIMVMISIGSCWTAPWPWRRRPAASGGSTCAPPSIRRRFGRPRRAHRAAARAGARPGAGPDHRAAAGSARRRRGTACPHSGIPICATGTSPGRGSSPATNAT